MNAQKQPGPDDPRSDGQPKRVELIQLADPVIHALAAGDLVAANQAAANQAASIVLTPFFVDPSQLSVWRLRSIQVREDPASARWITRVIWDVDKQIAVGRAGFHGPPDVAGMVEIGYAVDPLLRRQGYARAAVETMLERAACEPAVHTVRATISPANLPSRNLVLQYGFVEVGEQWDDEDGLETIYEVTSQLTAARA